MTFDDILAAADLPPPGPEFYAARRKLWLTPRSDVQPRASPQGQSTSRQRLEQLLSTPNAVQNDYVWNNGVEKVYKNLSAGGRLKRRLPMALIIKILHAAWLRDDTWPVGAVAPEPDDALPDEQLTPPVPPLYSPSLTEYSSGVTTPWMVVDRNEMDKNDSSTTR
ncbi:hypothetical protein Hypma_010013 [Hypsizygus marmoreus]|uniref:DUF4050 domain-containing protein n=1 Tax=Hypsizygus marmoreus TaxID=39966 RepID=A0A369JK27_HYPMA|nr:hypothetical protein Hypma_010013 [Hypsizygus marmoreus]